MKKEYHLTITRKDRIYLTVFVLFLLGWELVKPLIPVVFGGDMDKFKNGVNENPADSKPDSSAAISIGTEKNIFKGKTEMDETGNENDLLSEPVAVYIMDASPQELMSIGFTKKTAYIIRKYIDAGGVLYDEKGLMKIYSMDSAQLHAAAPFILYEERKSKPDSVSLGYTSKVPIAFLPMDLNAAIPSELETLPGIGPVLAERSIKFRDALGGFTSLDQLTECYGLTSETLEKIKPRLALVKSPTFISISQLGTTDFSHPYLDK